MNIEIPKDSNFVIKNKLRRSVVHALFRGKNKKNTKTQILLGTDYKTAKIHIESLFQPGMTWENNERVCNYCFRIYKIKS